MIKSSAFFGLLQRDGQVEPQVENPRAALLLSRGQVYIAWGSSCDHGSYYGCNLPSSMRRPTRREHNLAGWVPGLADDDGNVYGVTGNGFFNSAGALVATFTAACNPNHCLA